MLRKTGQQMKEKFISVFSGKIEVPEGLEKHAEDIRLNHGFVAYSDSSWILQSH